jgi:hypothetical protein
MSKRAVQVFSENWTKAIYKAEIQFGALRGKKKSNKNRIQMH